MLVEHEPVSLCNPGQGEPPFTGDGLSQALYRVLAPPTHVFVQGVQLSHEPQFPITKRKYTLAWSISVKTINGAKFFVVFLVKAQCLYIQ
jgi:hypothetical protein